MGSSWVHQREVGDGEGEGEAAEVMRGVGVGGGGGTADRRAEVEAAAAEGSGGTWLLLPLQLLEAGRAMVSLKETMGFETMSEMPAKRS